MSAVDFERTVNELLTQGGLSHVAFFHETGNRAPARYAINATFARLESDNGIGPRWIFQDVHEGGPAYDAGIRPGDILVTVNGEVVTPPALPTFALGTDATVTVRRAGESERTHRSRSCCRRRRRTEKRMPNRRWRSRRA